MNSLFSHYAHGCEVAQKAFEQELSNPPGSVLPFQAGVTSRDLLCEPHQTS